MTSNPCFGCTDREPGCHGKCDRYKDWSAQHRAEKDARFKQRQEEATFNKYKVEVRMHAKKRARMRKEVAK